MFNIFMQVDYMVYQREDLSSILYRFEESHEFAFSQFERLHMDGPDPELFDDGQITPNSILEDPLEYRNTTCTYNSMGNSGISQQPEMTKKKKKGSGFLPGIMLSLNNRRKGAPHRSPLS